jgi:hypothetical protein
MTRILKITVYSMFNLFLSLVKSDGVNEFGDLATVLKGFYNPLNSIEPSTSDNEIISDVVETTRRPVCLIRIDNNNLKENFELYFLTNETEWNTIYVVTIFGQYAMINKPKTPEKLIRKFEEIKNENTYADQDIQAVESELSDLMKLDYKKDFATLDAFKKIYQLNPSPSRKIRFENNSPKSSRKGILKTRKTNRSVPAPTPINNSPQPRTSPVTISPQPRTSPVNNSPHRTNKPTYMDWLFPKNPKKKTARNLGPGPAMREIIRRTHKGWEKKKVNT